MATSKATQNVNADLAAAVQNAQSRKRALAEYYKNGKQVVVQGSPFYKPYFGNNMPIQLNGIMVYVPLDGQPHKIPEDFANIFEERIKRIDMQNERFGIMGANIEESFAGEFELNLE